MSTNKFARKNDDQDFRVWGVSSNSSPITKTENLLSGVIPDAVEQYLFENEWEKRDGVKGVTNIWRIEGINYVYLPIDLELPDYLEALTRAINVIASYEKRIPLLLVSDIRKFMNSSSIEENGTSISTQKVDGNVELEMKIKQLENDQIIHIEGVGIILVFGNNQDNS